MSRKEKPKNAKEKTFRTLAQASAIAIILLAVAPTSTPAAEKYIKTTVIPPGIAMPDKVETQLGTLKFFDGFPDDASVQKRYDNQDFPQVSSLDKGLAVNQDGSVDVYFGPKAPAGMEKNWIQTVPGKGWNMLFRLYGPLEPWFDRTWKLSEIELVN